MADIKILDQAGVFQLYHVAVFGFVLALESDMTTKMVSTSPYIHACVILRVPEVDLHSFCIVFTLLPIQGHSKFFKRPSFYFNSTLLISTKAALLLDRVKLIWASQWMDWASVAMDSIGSQVSESCWVERKHAAAAAAAAAERINESAAASRRGNDKVTRWV